MPPIELNQEPILETNEEGEVHVKPVIGIIHPPPEVRNIVDKTASFVARNGPEFETRIRQNELNNPKFNFLNPSDPYHSYYQYKVKEFKEGKALEPAAPKPVSLLRPSYEPTAKFIEPIVPKEPPPEFEFIADPPSISAFDLDVVKLTAQFVARNGRQFLTNLMNREKNYQFDFLRPQHSLFNHFTKLVEQYTKVLIPPKDLPGKLRKDADGPNLILDQVKYRVEWAKFQERERLKEEAAQERERVAYASIDWHDFVVVETVDFPPHEQGNLPPPTTPEEVGARLLAQERFEVDGEEDNTVEMEVESDDEGGDDDEDVPVRRPGGPPGDDREVQDMEEDSDSEEEEEQRRPQRPREPAPPPPPPPHASRPQPPPLPPTPEEIIIKKDYNPKAPKQAQVTPQPDQFLISPITGEKIPAAKIHEHVRIGLLDPKWIEQRDRQLADKRDQEEVYAAGSSIGTNLKQLAERRTDIFGAGAEEAQIGKKIGEEERRPKEKVTWDGHTASMERVTQKARENISIEEQIAVIHKVKGLLPDEEKEKIGPARPKDSNEPRPPPPPPHSMQMQMPQPPRNMPQPMPPRMAPPPQQPKPMQPPQQPPQQPKQQQQVPMPPRPPQMMLVPQRPPMPPGPPDGRHHMFQMRPPMPPMPPGHHMGGHPGFMHGGPPMHPQMQQQMQPPPQQRHQPPPPEDEPPSKKAKTEEDLIPEDEFLKRNKGPVLFRVAVPNLTDKPEWKANGQVLMLTMPLTDSVAVIKAKIHEAIGMQAGKQKLQYDGLFIKDSNTLAFYNLTRNATVQLQLKERGGRKK